MCRAAERPVRVRPDPQRTSQLNLVYQLSLNETLANKQAIQFNAYNFLQP
jgi:hypothetical protein